LSEERIRDKAMIGGIKHTQSIQDRRREEKQNREAMRETYDGRLDEG
jgi:chorismate mutase